PLVKDALRVLVNQLGQGDQVAIVVFSDQARVALLPTSGQDRGAILQAIDSLQIGGATSVEDGLRKGYELATQHYKPGAINRLILCSDGEANVGATGPGGILQTIHDYTNQGITLTTVGFGIGDYNDGMMEQLADQGNGQYAYVDTLDAAQRIFVE